MDVNWNKPTYYSLVVFGIRTDVVLPFKKACNGSWAPESNQLIPTGWLFRFVVASISQMPSSVRAADFRGQRR
jgi:hypothetical protein